MYEVVYKALEEVGLQNTYEPQDYLNFFCLGNREVTEGNGASNGNPAADTPHVNSPLPTRHFFIDFYILLLYFLGEKQYKRSHECYSTFCNFEVCLLVCLTDRSTYLSHPFRACMPACHMYERSKLFIRCSPNICMPWPKDLASPLVKWASYILKFNE